MERRGMGMLMLPRNARRLLVALLQQARQESNLQPPVLETGALPIELRTYKLTLPEVTASNPAAAPSQPSSCQAVDSQRLRVARAVLGAPYVGSRRMRATPTQPTHRAVRQPRRRPCQTRPCCSP